MAGRKLVSVLTPTWQRHDLLRGAIKTLREQTYRPLEHVVVSDGPDAALRQLWNIQWSGSRRAAVPVRLMALGRNWSTFLPASFCAAPMTVAMLMARGEYQMWLADDERMATDHIASLVSAIEAGGADFAYSKVEMRWHDDRGPAWVIGTDPPREGQITNVLYRTDLLKRGLFPFGAGMTSDWACIKRWMDAGAVWAFVDRVTLTHRVDH